MVTGIAVFPYANTATWCGVGISEYSHMKEWRDKLAQRPAFQTWLNSPVPYPFSDEAVPSPEKQDFYNNIRYMGSVGMKMATEQ